MSAERSPLETQIAEVLREHRPVYDPDGHINGTIPGSVDVYDCWCGLVVNATLTDCTAHQASVVAAALFTQEVDVRATYAPVPGSPYFGHEGFQGYKPFTRWVSSWEQS